MKRVAPVEGVSAAPGSRSRLCVVRDPITPSCRDAQDEASVVRWIQESLLFGLVAILFDRWEGPVLRCAPLPPGVLEDGEPGS